MSTAPHVIECLHLRLAPGADARAVQQRAEAVLQSRALLDALDAALTAAGRPTSWIVLDRLDLDLGHLDSAQLENQVLERLPDLLRRQVAEAVAAATHGAAVAGVEIHGSAATAWAAWLHFLRHGTLPAHWPAPASAAAWETELLRLLPGGAQRPGLREVLADASARQRLVRQFSVGLAVAVLVALDATARPHQPELTDALTPLLERLGSYTGALGEEVVAELLAAAAAQRLVRWRVLRAVLAPPQRLAQPEVLTRLAWTALAVARSPEARLKGPAAPTTVATAATAASAGFVANAGVVLLHPFLPACFAARGWLKHGGFVSETARAKAVLLVHYLATGASQAPEHALRLPKLLCGMPAGSAPSHRLRLGRAACAEGQALLRAAIGHWGALRNTSPEGLREAFLQREGKLAPAADGSAILTVEQRAFDALLDRLPYGWGLGVVQLPWMPARLTIHWA